MVFRGVNVSEVARSVVEIDLNKLDTFSNQSIIKWAICEYKERELWEKDHRKIYSMSPNLYVDHDKGELNNSCIVNFVSFYLHGGLSLTKFCVGIIGKSIVHLPKVGNNFNSTTKVSIFSMNPLKVLIAFNSCTFSQNVLNNDFYFPKCPQ